MFSLFLIIEQRGSYPLFLRQHCILISFTGHLLQQVLGSEKGHQGVRQRTSNVTFSRMIIQGYFYYHYLFILHVYDILCACKIIHHKTQKQDKIICSKALILFVYMHRNGSERNQNKIIFISLDHKLTGEYFLKFFKLSIFNTNTVFNINIFPIINSKYLVKTAISSIKFQSSYCTE